MATRTFQNYITNGRLNNKLVILEDVYQSTSLSELSAESFGILRLDCSKFLEIDLMNSINLPSGREDSYGWAQGSCIDNNKKYIYLAIAGYDSKDSFPFGSRILKINYSTKEIENYVDNLNIYGSNSLTYNENNFLKIIKKKANQSGIYPSVETYGNFPVLVIPSINSAGTYLKTIHYFTNSLIEFVEISNLSFNPKFITYDNINERYALSSDTTIFILDKNLNSTKNFQFLSPYKIQDATCNKDFIFIASNKIIDEYGLKCENIIDVIDWDGKHISRFFVPIVENKHFSPKLESLFSTNDKLFGVFSNWEKATIYEFSLWLRS